MTDLIIIGGGAAGMAAGILGARAGMTVTILEKNRQFGRKLGVTGNGKCNFTNAFQAPERYRSDAGDLAWQILESFPVTATLEFFRSLGLEYRERNGYYYPLSDTAEDVVKVLFDELRTLKVKCKTNLPVQGIVPTSGGFRVQTEGYAYEASRVLLAAGGMAAPQHGTEGDGYDMVRKLGHQLIPPVPALTALKTDTDRDITTLAGLRWQGRICLGVEREDPEEPGTFRPGMVSEDTGELQFTSYGISGIPAMQVSRYAARALEEGKMVHAELDFFPESPEEDIRQLIHNRLETRAGRSVQDWFTGWLPEKLTALLLKIAEIPGNCPVEQVEESDWRTIAGLLKCYPLTITGVRDFDAAQVTSGGIPLTECSGYLESLRVPGLYFAGEILDVDGACGGYNLQWAWASAARAIEGMLRDRKTMTDRL